MTLDKHRVPGSVDKHLADIRAQSVTATSSQYESVNAEDLDIGGNNFAASGNVYRLTSVPFITTDGEVSTTSSTYTTVSSGGGPIDLSEFSGDVRVRFSVMGENTTGAMTYVKPKIITNFDNNPPWDEVEVTFDRNSDGNKRRYQSNWVDPSSTPYRLQQIQMKVDGGTGKIYANSAEIQIGVQL